MLPADANASWRNHAGVFRNFVSLPQFGNTGICIRSSQDTSLKGLQGLIESWACLSYASMLGSLSRESAAHMCVPSKVFDFFNDQECERLTTIKFFQSPEKPNPTTSMGKRA